MLRNLFSFLLPEACLVEYFEHHNYLHAECFKIGLSKTLGYGIVVGSSLVKVPQIAKVIYGRSAAGLSILSLLMELLCYTTTVAYSLAHGFPFSSYGEGTFLAIQTFIITFLTISWEKSNFGGAVFAGIYSLFAGWCVSPAVSLVALFGLQTLNVPIMVASKLMQCWTNWRNGSTGQLSAITICLITLGSMARIFTSAQETGDKLMVLTYLLAFLCNSLLTCQLFYYWKSPQPHEAAKKKLHNRKQT